ncbi:type II toxin-antitoxin system VapC family toxin [Burkholderia stagnalis]|uniref:type II toxin-antitoxin system VapC family toxin n=1 Tax=Burkholderia stagnalis TaxID=1503054 RepID=UPI00075DEB0A|nr:PIN domain-containing protein [Burkholderia stagnalis]KVM81977.1 twitching motility protein PilT [Burkholderia stagnalis]
MSVLVDTSVWVEHFRRPLPALIQLLRVDNVLMHPLVMLELTCGTPPEPRARTLGDLALLRQTRLATPGEVTDWIERERLYGRGCGAVDCTLLASVLLTPSSWLWTRDRRLVHLAEQFGVLYAPPDLP